MTGDGTISAEAAGLSASSESLGTAAELLLTKLRDLDGQVQNTLTAWQGSSGGAYSSAWDLWRRGAAEVELGLSIMARLVGQAGGAYTENESRSAEALGGLAGG